MLASLVHEVKRTDTGNRVQDGCRYKQLWETKIWWINSTFFQSIRNMQDWGAWGKPLLAFNSIFLSWDLLYASSVLSKWLENLLNCHVGHAKNHVRCHPWHKSGILGLNTSSTLDWVESEFSMLPNLEKAADILWITTSGQQHLATFSYLMSKTMNWFIVTSKWRHSSSVNHKNVQEVKGKASIRYLHWKFEPLVLAISRRIVLCLCIERNEVTVLGLII